MRKLANKVLARVARSVIVPVFSRVAPKPCSKCMDRGLLHRRGDRGRVGVALAPPAGWEAPVVMVKRCFGMLRRRSRPA